MSFKQHREVIRERDFIVFVTQNGITEQDEIKMREICEEISEDTEATIAVFPDRVYKEMHKLPLLELIQLREILDRAIQDLIERDSMNAD